MAMENVTSPDSPKRQTNGFIVTITAILALLSKRTNRLTGKPKSTATKEEEWKIDLRTPKSRPKKLLSNISSKALLPFGHNKKKKEMEENKEEKEKGWGNGGVWQKEILMGGKCEPLDFSGAIYYDINGKQTSEIPLRSPRASPLPGYLTRPRQ